MLVAMVCDNFWNSASLRDDLLLVEYDDELILKITVKKKNQRSINNSDSD